MEEKILYEENFRRIGVNTDDDIPLYEQTIKISNTYNNYQMCFSRW